MTMPEAPAAQDQDIDERADDLEVDPSGTPPAAVESEREKDLRDRLATQGRQLAEVRTQNQRLAENLAVIIQRSEAMEAGLTAHQRELERRQQRDTQEYLNSLPPEQRQAEELKYANQRIHRLEGMISGRTAANPQPAPRQQPARQQQESPEAYQRRRSGEIIREAETEFGVKLDRTSLEAIPEAAWDSEEGFFRAINTTAARIAAKPASSEPGSDDEESDMPRGNKPADETTVRRKVLDDLGVSGPSAPRATPVKKGKSPDADQVKAAASTYDSRSGPRSNVARLKQMREKMG